jgi:drug/metabolite transporter superfamily protein YnfA
MRRTDALSRRKIHGRKFGAHGGVYVVIYAG